MKNWNPLVKVPLKYGAAGAVLAIILLVILYFANRHPLLIPIIYDYRILLFGILIFFSLKEFRDYHNGGVLHFWQAMAAGIMCYMTVAVVAGIFILVLGMVEPNFVDSYVKIALSDLESNKELFVEYENSTFKVGNFTLLSSS